MFSDRNGHNCSAATAAEYGTNATAKARSLVFVGHVDNSKRCSHRGEQNRDASQCSEHAPRAIDPFRLFVSLVVVPSEPLSFNVAELLDQLVAKLRKIKVRKRVGIQLDGQQSVGRH